MDDLASLGLSKVDMFISVAHHGNLKDAALEMNVVPSTISKNISQLEKDLNITLFTRENQILNLSIGLHNNLKHDKLFTAIRKVQSELSELTVNFVNEDPISLIEKFNANELDMIVVCEKDLPLITDGNVIFKAITGSRLCVFLSKNHALYSSLQGRSEVSLEELMPYSFISIKHEGLPFYDDILTHISQDYDFPMQIVNTVGNTQSVSAYLELGTTLMIAPSYIDIPDDNLMQIPVFGLDEYSGSQVLLWYQDSLKIHVLQKIAHEI